MDTSIIGTKRLILRKFTEDDMGAIYKIYSDAEVNRFLPWFPIRTMAQAEEIYNEKLKSCDYNYAVCLKSDNIPVGYVNVSMDDSCDLGYGLRKEFWYKGITAEAAEAVIEKLRRDGVPYITATHDVNNPRSGEVMRKLGMKYCYSYEERWMPKDITVVFRMYQLNLDGDTKRVYKKYWDKYPVHFIEENL